MRKKSIHIILLRALLLLSVVMLIIVIILNVNKYRIRQLDNEFEKRINTEYKGPRGNDNSPK